VVEGKIILTAKDIKHSAIFYHRNMLGYKL